MPFAFSQRVRPKHGTTADLGEYRQTAGAFAEGRHQISGTDNPIAIVRLTVTRWRGAVVACPSPRMANEALHPHIIPMQDIEGRAARINLDVS
jgi:hypothetical protein